MTLELFVLRRLQRQQLNALGRLRHGVHELVVHHVQPVDLAIFVGVQHHLDGADQVAQVRGVAQAVNGGLNVAADTLEESDALAAYHAVLRLGAFLLPLTGAFHDLLQQVGVQAATQAPVGRHHDVTDVFHFPLLQVDVPVLQISVGKMGNHLTHTARVGLAGSHTVLRFAHFTGCHHLHRTSNLLRALDTRDLAFDLFTASHRTNPFLANYQVWVDLN